MEGQIDLSNRFFYAITVLIVGVLVFLVGQIAYQQEMLNNQNTNQVVVSGEGKVYAKPDVATVSLGVKIDGQDIKTITESNVTKVNNIVADMKALGIEEKDIQTTNYSVYPQYNWTQESGSVPNGYTIEQSISVKIRDFSKIGDVLSKASASGANTIGSLQFTVDDIDKYRQEARAIAIAKAKVSAENLARQSGIKLGKIVNIYENSALPPIMYSKDIAMGMGGAPEAMAVPTIQAGQNEISVTVNVSYQVK